MSSAVTPRSLWLIAALSSAARAHPPAPKARTATTSQAPELTPPELIFAPAPAYPQDALRARVAGAVNLEIEVTATGTFGAPGERAVGVPQPGRARGGGVLSI
jgi:outer membrane biosynthesis protein TonB